MSVIWYEFYQNMSITLTNFNTNNISIFVLNSFVICCKYITYSRGCPCLYEHACDLHSQCSTCRYRQHRFFGQRRTTLSSVGRYTTTSSSSQKHRHHDILAYSTCGAYHRSLVSRRRACVSDFAAIICCNLLFIRMQQPCAQITCS